MAATQKRRKKTRGQIISKGPDRWLIRAFEGRDEKGKKKYSSQSVHGPYSEAQKALTKLLADIDNGARLSSKDRLKDYVTRYVNGKELEPRTRAEYHKRLSLDIYPVFGKKKLKELTRVELQEHFLALAKPPRNLSARTRQYTYMILKQALEQARRDGLIVRNPMADVQRPKLRQSSKVQKIQPLDDDQVASLFQATEGDRLHTLWVFLLTTGVRPGEAMGLEWRNVFLDDEQPYVMIEQSLTKGEKGKLEIRGTKTEGSIRRVTLPPITVRKLREHRLWMKKYLMRRGKRTDLVFPNLAGKPIDINRLRYHWKRACKKAGIPQVRLYDARHTHATWLLNNGVSPKVAAERLGHTSTKMFLDVYTHVTKQETDKAVEILAAAYG